MAKILLHCCIADGHGNPFLPVAKHLIEEGHEILWIGGRGIVLSFTSYRK